MTDALQEKLKGLPKTPGVYFHKSRDGEGGRDERPRQHELSEGSGIQRDDAAQPDQCQPRQ